MTASFDAAVVGAGPAGAATAILLARAGWSVALIERQTFPRRKVCGECIAASNLALLDALGIGPEFERRAGAELRRVALLRGDDAIVAALPGGEGGLRRWGRASPTPPRLPARRACSRARCRRSTAAPAPFACDCARSPVPTT
jgi:2-polyprenyl-6-methoxyphenol hydroxylase-like FAD-dependent oxidoreductase